MVSGRIINVVLATLYLEYSLRKANIEMLPKNRTEA